MFRVLVRLHLRISRSLLNVSIGLRLFALMGVAASVSILLAAAGILGLAASKDALRSVYEDRMLPMQRLQAIGDLMLVNRLLLQTALNEVDVSTDTRGQPAIRLNGAAALSAADSISTNIEKIGSLWADYVAGLQSAEELRLAEHFAVSRGAYVEQTLVPAVRALRDGRFDDARAHAGQARQLFERTAPDLRSLHTLQYRKAREAYALGVRRFETTRLMAVSALCVTIVVMTWLGLILLTSIVDPLMRVITVFQRISAGHYDSPIAPHGKDEISQVMRALKDMQAKLGADEQSIHELAFYDPLTKLPNRRLLRDRLQRALSMSARSRLHGAVLMIDLDNFKRINDTLGHDLGDRLLTDVASRIQSCVRLCDTVARLGGDEFIILLEDLGSNEEQAAQQAEAIGEKILAAVNHPCRLEGRIHHSTASMGLCLFLGQDVTLDDLLKRADMSMYEAKNSGRNALRFYDPQVQNTLEQRIALESELREAQGRNQLRLHYQIQIDNALGVLGAEVLLRWEHPRHGLINPEQFIPIAEESGLILPIGEWVLRTVCEQLAVWARDPVMHGLGLSVNVSALQFRQPDFVALVSKILAETAIDTNCLKLELTESLVLHDIVDTISKMKVLNRCGVHFSMDDFGTGYSSLSHLTVLPIQQLKIDRSFVSNIASNRNDAVIVQTIIGMAHNLGVAVIAEGVETEEQRAFLEGFGCSCYQGYLYGKPLPLAEFEQLAVRTIAA